MGHQWWTTTEAGRATVASSAFYRCLERRYSVVAPSCCWHLAPPGGVGHWPSQAPWLLPATCAEAGQWWRQRVALGDSAAVKMVGGIHPRRTRGVVNSVGGSRRTFRRWLHERRGRASVGTRRAVARRSGARARNVLGQRLFNGL